MSIARVGLMAKSMVGSLLPIALVIVLSVICYATIIELESAVTFADRRGRVTSFVMGGLANGLEAFSALRTYVSSGEDSALQQYKVSSDRALSLISKAREATADKQTAQLLDAALREFRKWQSHEADSTAENRKRVLDQQGHRSASPASELSRHFEAFTKVTADVVSREEHTFGALRASSAGHSDLARKGIFILAFAVIAVAFTKNYVLATRTTKPLVAAVNLAEAIGKGDLNQSRIEAKGNDEVSRLSAALNEMLENLKRQALAIREGVSVSLKSEERIASAVSQLSTSTSRTAAALTEATATVEQIRQAANVSSMKAKNVAAASQQAVRISESGLKAAEESARKIRLIEEQMKAIGDSVLKLSENAQAIEDVASVVKDLADQSNLLAVNASIEAARAGAQGKGFGVVAHEIKILAEGSKEAVENVRTILDEIRKSIGSVVMATEDGNRSVAAGVAQSAAAGDSIRELADRVAASSQAATVIEVTSEQQFTAMDQVATAMADIQKAVNENLEGSSQLESAVLELNQLGANLKQILGRFKV